MSKMKQFTDLVLSESGDILEKYFFVFNQGLIDLAQDASIIETISYELKHTFEKYASALREVEKRAQEFADTNFTSFINDDTWIRTIVSIKEMLVFFKHERNQDLKKVLAYKIRNLKPDEYCGIDNVEDFLENIFDFLEEKTRSFSFDPYNTYPPIHNLPQSANETELAMSSPTMNMVDSYVPEFLFEGVIDQLRIELQNITPEEYSKLKEEAKFVVFLIYKKFVKLMGSSFDESSLSYYFQKTNNIINVSKNGFKKFSYLWEQPDARIKARYAKLGTARIIGEYTFGNFYELQNKLLKDFDPNSSNYLNIKRSLVWYILAHEMYHHFQNPDLPLWFMECAVYFYTNELLKEIFGAYIENPISKTAEQYYIYLESIYGRENLDKLFFGKHFFEYFDGKFNDLESHVKNLPLGEIKKIFPKYRA